MKVSTHSIAALLMITFLSALSGQAQSQSDTNAAVEAYNRGIDLLNTGKYEEAITHFDQAISINPKYTEAYNNRGIAYYSLGQHERAVKDYEHAISINPKFAEAYYNRGIVYNDLGEINRAIQNFDQAIRLNPRYTAAYNNRGFAYYNLGQYRRAIQDYNQAIRITPNYAKAYYNRAIGYNDLGQYDRAVEDFNESLRLDPKSAEAYNNRGVAYVHLGQYDLALQDFTGAISADPSFAMASYNRGYVNLILARNEPAATDANTYLRLEGWRADRSQYAVLLAHFGYKQARRDEDARKILDEAVVRCDASAWPFPIIRYLRGEILASQLLASANDSVKMADARTYLGLDRFVAGSDVDASKQLGWVRGKVKRRSFEYHLSQTLLRTITERLSNTERR